MYFSGKIGIRPSQETIVEAVKPSHMFGKVFHFLSAGLTSKKEEHETFHALSILQQINVILRRSDINNIVRLAKDDFDFYLDEEGVEDDLKDAIEHFLSRVDQLESEVFKTLYLVLEHEVEGLRFLIEVDVNRIHKVGEMPIVIRINGLLGDFSKPGENKVDQVKAQISSVFENQTKYDGFLREKKHAFDGFVQMLEQNIRTHIRVDSVESDTQSNLVRPKEPMKRSSDIPQKRHVEPIYYGYHGYQDAFFYAWLWSEMSYSHNIHLHDVTVVDDTGNAMFSVGTEGFDAGNNDAMNVDAPFEAPAASDIEYFSGHEFQETFEASNLLEGSTESVDSSDDESKSGGGWLDFDSSDSSDNASSCSSCSSCGGDV